MGGHKSGGSRGHSGNALRTRNGRNCHPDDRPALSRSLDVPGEELRKAGAKLGAKKAKREEAIRVIREAKAAKRIAYGVGKASDRQTLAAMALHAAKGHIDHNNKLAAAAATSAAGPSGTGPDLSLKKFSKEFKKVIEMSDVLLQILDARDPLGCRLFEFEQAIQSTYGDSKTIVMLLNKADMVPDQTTVDAWVSYFADRHIVAVPFSAKNSREPRFAFCVPEVFKVLRKLGRVDLKSNARKSLTVGVIGYPNVGKSSTINTLKGKAVVGVANMPGFTTGNTEVDLRSDIKIIDCPGVVVRGADGSDVALRNASKIESVEDPLVVIEQVIERADLEVLCAVYGVPVPSKMGNPASEFLRSIALKRGRVKSGGVLELSEAARVVLKDWNDGRIVHYTRPPLSDTYTTGASGHEIGDEPELLKAFTNSSVVLPPIVVVPPQGALPATWELPETVKHAGKIKYHPMDTSSSDDEEEVDSDDDGANADDSDNEA